MDESKLMLIVIIGLLGAASSFYLLIRLWRKKALYRWADRNDLQIIYYDQPIFTEESPFSLTTSKAQPVFQFTAKLKSGKIRSGWVLLGNGFSGLLSDDAEVQWDDEQQ
jgi:hypothetical protein